MEAISIKKLTETDEGWMFDVEARDDEEVLEYLVEVEEDYWDQLTGERCKEEKPCDPGKRLDPDELVKKSFEFLLKREPRKSILKKFNLRDINKYFPEYEKEIKEYANKKHDESR